MTEAGRSVAARVTLVIIAALMVAGVWLSITASSAGAKPGADPYSSKKPKVLPTIISNVGDEPVQPSRTERGTLPFTGGDVVVFAVIGAAAVATGFVLVRRARHQA